MRGEGGGKTKTKKELILDYTIEITFIRSDVIDVRNI